MRAILALPVVALLLAGRAAAQPYGLPPGDYQRQCWDLRMDGPMLSATCRGAYGQAAQSSINVLSCATDIRVDQEGGLACLGPGAAPAYAPPAYGRGGAAILYGARDWRGPAVEVDGDAPDLDHTGLNDRVRSIRLEPGSGPWIVCSDADYGGRCVTIDESVPDTRALGLGYSISSLRPVW